MNFALQLQQYGYVVIVYYKPDHEYSGFNGWTKNGSDAYCKVESYTQDVRDIILAGENDKE